MRTGKTSHASDGARWREVVKTEFISPMPRSVRLLMRSWQPAFNRAQFDEICLFDAHSKQCREAFIPHRKLLKKPARTATLEEVKEEDGDRTESSVSLAVFLHDLESIECFRESYGATQNRWAHEQMLQRFRFAIVFFRKPIDSLVDGVSWT